LMIIWLLPLMNSLTVSARAGSLPSNRFSSRTVAPRMSKSMFVFRMPSFCRPGGPVEAMEADPTPVTPSRLA